MSTVKLRRYALSLLLCFSAFSCISLSEVSLFSTTSMQAVAQHNQLAYSYTLACWERCEMNNIKALLEDRLVNVSRQACQCAEAQKADSVNAHIYLVLTEYFEALSRIAGDETVSLAPIEQSINANTYGELKITDGQAKAYLGLTKTLLNSAVYKLKKAKVINFIGEANEPVQTLIEALKFNLTENLSKHLVVSKERYTSIYFDFLNDDIGKKISPYEKIEALAKFREKINEINQKSQQIKLLDKVLFEVAEGHQRLYLDRNHLLRRSLKRQLARYATDISILRDQFKSVVN